jgi:hypothetical protein
MGDRVTGRRSNLVRPAAPDKRSPSRYRIAQDRAVNLPAQFLAAVRGSPDMLHV